MSADLILATGWGWGAWVWLMVPLAIYAVVSLTLFAMGRNNGPAFTDFFFGNISDSLRRATGFPGWSMAGVLSGLHFLLVVVVGFYWDVAWHIDNGRDVELFTPSHVMILVGLGGLIYTAYLTMLFATLEDVKSGIRVGFVRVPWSALLLLSLGVGGVAAFPLDNLWHEAYGLDVTLWSPTHLQLLGGGSLATLALFLMCAEALPAARPTLLGRFIMALTGGTVLVGLSTFLGEFDFGVPQFQAIYLPILIVAAASMALVLARLALGPWARSRWRWSTWSCAGSWRWRSAGRSTTPCPGSRCTCRRRCWWRRPRWRWGPGRGCDWRSWRGGWSARSGWPWSWSGSGCRAGWRPGRCRRRCW